MKKELLIKAILVSYPSTNNKHPKHNFILGVQNNSLQSLKLLALINSGLRYVDGINSTSNVSYSLLVSYLTNVVVIFIR